MYIFIYSSPAGTRKHKRSGRLMNERRICEFHPSEWGKIHGWTHGVWIRQRHSSSSLSWPHQPFTLSFILSFTLMILSNKDQMVSVCVSDSQKNIQSFLSWDQCFWSRTHSVNSNRSIFRLLTQAVFDLSSCFSWLHYMFVVFLFNINIVIIVDFIDSNTK